jgi:hypothetical protein
MLLQAFSPITRLHRNNQICWDYSSSGTSKCKAPYVVIALTYYFQCQQVNMHVSTAV